MKPQENLWKLNSPLLQMMPQHFNATTSKNVLYTPILADYIFIYVTTVSAHVIPKKCFANSEQAQLFYQTAKKYFDNARQAAS